MASVALGFITLGLVTLGLVTLGSVPLETLVVLGLQAILLLLILGSIVFYLACIAVTWNFFRKAASNSSHHVDSVANQVSILVPICGLDAGAWENWTSLCHQQCDRYEILFGAVDSDDPAVPLLYELQKHYPDRVRIFTGLTPRGVNHKDSTLSYLLEQAQYDWLILADSDIQVAPDYIQTVISPLINGQIGMITCAFIARSPQHLGSAIASLGRCCDFIPSALIARAMDGGLRFAIGMTMALHRSTLEAAGGLHLNRIGSDYNLGKRVAAAGYRVELSHLIMESDTGNEPLQAVYQRELRWSRTIRFNRGNIYYTIAFCYGIVYCIPLLLLSGSPHWGIIVSIATLILRYGQAAIAMLSMGAPRLLPWLWVLPLRDCMSFGIWLAGCFGQQVFWRGRKLQIRKDGLISEL
ncbi:glycosyltransferase [Alkalinema sp. FACHB-956]|uniref:glycosyltransferase n=1 Tax=Alkalinema sp. FACHB-956 TaxID=2692768 RepID=UPI001682FC93|nr:glycosyltransferase [Alkalinema sp. FACHB-956]MBD2327173.1 glycosyltransferase [Alkalinema sp. FACHB-956]